MGNRHIVKNRLLTPKKHLQVTLLLWWVTWLTACADLPQKHSDELQQQEQELLKPDDDSLHLAVMQTSQAVADAIKARSGFENYLLAMGKPLPQPSTGPMAAPLNLIWIGPVEPLLNSIAHKIGWNFVVEGVATDSMLLVSVHQKGESVFHALEAIGSQCGDRATVQADAKRREIRLIYPKKEKH